jgi:hypothetical protein
VLVLSHTMSAAKRLDLNDPSRPPFPCEGKYITIIHRKLCSPLLTHHSAVQCSEIELSPLNILPVPLCNMCQTVSSWIILCPTWGNLGQQSSINISAIRRGEANRDLGQKPPRFWDPGHILEAIWRMKASNRIS